MATRKLLDLRPGAIPDIRADGDHITYVLEIVGGQTGGGRLIIRCDDDGSVWASMERHQSARRIDDSG